MFRSNNLSGTRSRSKGFIMYIVLIIIALVLLKYFFNITFKDIFTNQVVLDVWTIIKSLFKVLWDTILILLEFIKQLLATAKVFVAGLNK